MQILDGQTAFWQGWLGALTSSGPFVPPPNQRPVAGPDTATVEAGGTVIVAVLANDTDPEGGVLTVTGAAAGSGTVEVLADDTLSYTSAGTPGSDTITYTIADPEGATSEGTVAVTVTDVVVINEAPVAGADAAEVVEGETITIAVLANDLDPEGGALTVTAATADVGTVAVGADGILTYTAPDAAESDTITYTVADPEGATGEGTVTVTILDVALSIAEGASSDRVTITAQKGDLDIVIDEPLDYAGTYTLTTAALQQGPVTLVAPEVDGTAGMGDTLTARTGLWAYDEGLGPLVLSWQWYRGDTAIPGATGAEHVVEADDITGGLRLVLTAANDAGARQVEIEAIEPGPAPDAFAETGVVFDGTAHLVHNADLGADTTTFLWFASLAPRDDSRQAILRQSARTAGIDLWGGCYRVRMEGTDGTDYRVDSRPYPSGERSHVLCALRDNGDGTSTFAMATRFASESAWVQEYEDTDTTRTVRLSYGSFFFGIDPTLIHPLDATVYRVAFWAGGAVPDILDPAVQAAFVRPDGALVDPGVSHAAHGAPRIDVFGPAAEYAAGTNHGSAGIFDTVTGAFLDA